ncbi:MAG TPA: type II toxin-antitoxin system Phd/YefM family antitoxin [Armatimonadota bacterium]
MTRQTVTEAKARLSQLLHRVEQGGERVIIERRGQPVAALVPLADLPLAERLAEDWLGALLELGAAGAELGEQLAAAQATRT